MSLDRTAKASGLEEVRSERGHISVEVTDLGAAEPENIVKSAPVFMMGVIVGALLGLTLPTLFKGAPDEPAPSYERTQRIEAVEKPVVTLPTSIPTAAPAPAPIGKPKVPKPKAPPPPPKPAGPTLAELSNAHFEDSIDADWSEKASETVKRDLDALAETGRFSVTNLDCRRISCIATLEWNEVDHAMAALPGLLQATYALECKKLLVPPGRTPDGKIQSTLVFYACAR